MLVADGTHAFGVGQVRMLSSRGTPKSMAPNNCLFVSSRLFYPAASRRILMTRLPARLTNLRNLPDIFQSIRPKKESKRHIFWINSLQLKTANVDFFRASRLAFPLSFLV